MVLLSALIAIIGGQSIGAVFGAFTAAQWITLASDMISASPDVIEGLEAVIPAFAGVGDLIKKGVEDVVLGPLMSEGFKKWIAANGDAAVTFQSARDKDA
jgi:hypothetical protein